MNDEELKDILLQANLLTPQDIERAIEETKKLKRPLEQVILDMRLLDREVLYRTIAQKLEVEYKKIDNLTVPKELLRIYPEDLARSTKSVPLFIKEGTLHVALANPQDFTLTDQIQLFTNYPLFVYLSSPQEIEEAINRIYREEKEEILFTDLETPPTVSPKKEEESKPLSETTSIIKVVDLLITQAVRDRASDIHIEPEESVTRIRFRIDGILHEVPPPPKEWESAIISRIKVLAGMDIAESRSPQDGHFQATIDDKLIDFRVSTLPTIHGENVVLRLLDTASVAIGLEKLGFTTPQDLKKYEELITKPYGIILSTGPTGCGKTTTLYSALMRINTMDKNIITLEDPVEYRLGLIRQVQVNPKAGITFANGLRAILRQDPDVIMVGEIRDLETARMAVQAALTGHLVFSTLHTNDAPSAVARLIDMGVEDFLVAASLIGVMAQRLVRVICLKCKEAYKPSPTILKKWRIEKEDVEVYRAEGCPECKGTGYRGRTGIFELMVVDDEIKEMINQGASTVALRKKAQEKGMRLLWEDGREKVLRGITTFEEVARVCEEQIEVKPAKIEVKPYLGKEIEVKRATVREVKIDPKALEEYRARIARWMKNE